jgi:hypothetical protein
MMMVMPSNHSSIATCLQQKPLGNGITDPVKKSLIPVDKKIWMPAKRRKYLEPKKNWDRCYDFKNIFAEKFGEKNGVF